MYFLRKTFFLRQMLCTASYVALCVWTKITSIYLINLNFIVVGWVLHEMLYEWSLLLYFILFYFNFIFLRDNSWETKGASTLTPLKDSCQLGF